MGEDRCVAYVASRGAVCRVQGTFAFAAWHNQSMALPLSKQGLTRRTWTTDENRGRLHACGFDPFLHLVALASNNIPCPHCQRTNGKARYTLPRARRSPCSCDGADAECWQCEGTGTTLRAERICRKCHGMRTGVVSEDQQINACTKLMPYVAQQLKQVDHVSSDGSQVTGIRIISVRADTVIEAGTSSARLMEAHERGNSGD